MPGLLNMYKPYIKSKNTSLVSPHFVGTKCVIWLKNIKTLVMIVIGWISKASNILIIGLKFKDLIIYDSTINN